MLLDPHIGRAGQRNIIAVATAAFIAGCGGGGGTETPPVQAPPAPMAQPPDQSSTSPSTAQTPPSPTPALAQQEPTTFSPNGTPTNSCVEDPTCKNAAKVPTETSPSQTETSPSDSKSTAPSQTETSPSAPSQTETSPSAPSQSGTAPSDVSQAGSQSGTAPSQDQSQAQDQSQSQKQPETEPPVQPVKPPVVSPPPVVQAVNRHTTDMSDDVLGQQIHVIYAVPKGNADRGLDITNRFINSIGSINNWLKQQTNDTLEMKLDTYQGRLDITYVDLPRTDADYETWGAKKLLPIQDDLKALGQIRDDKIYYVYYDGDWSVSCGTAANILHGDRVAVQFVKGLSNRPGVNPCDNNPIAQSPTDAPTYLDRVVLHELLHLIGIPHVSDSPTDIMYGYEYGVPANPPSDSQFVLDYGHDNYAFDRSSGNYARGQINVYDSPFFQRIIH